MRLVNLRGPLFYFACIRCGMRTDSTQPGAAADLDGVPFCAYYCGPCADVRRAERKAADIVQGVIKEQTA